MEWVEISGRTLEEAKELALEQLGVAESDAEWIVLAEPKVGLFGRTRGEARVRARVRPVGPRPKRQRRPRRTAGSVERNGNQRKSAARSQAEDRNLSEDARGERKAVRTGGSGRRRRSNASGRSNVRAVVQVGGSAEAMEEKGPEVSKGITLEEQAAVGKEFLMGLLEAYGYDATVETGVIDEETIKIAATGSELGLLVGPRGATLAALQDVVRTVVQHRFPTRTDRIVVDVAGYRERRVVALQRFTRQLAEEVRTSGSERALEPMSPADRKVVHDTVNEMEGLITRSEGEDATRHVVIAPRT